MSEEHEGKALASGYIDLTIKYRNGMQQVSKDFDQLHEQASAAGKKAGDKLGAELQSSVAAHVSKTSNTIGQNLGDGIARNLQNVWQAAEKKQVTAGVDMTRNAAKIGVAVGEELSKPITKALDATVGHARSAWKAVARDQESAGIDMTRRANRIGTAVGAALGKGIALPIDAVKLGGHGIAKTVGAFDLGAKFEDIRKEHSKELSSNVPGLGGLTEALGALAPEAALAAVAIGSVTAVMSKAVEAGKDYDSITAKIGFATGLPGGEALMTNRNDPRAQRSGIMAKSAMELSTQIPVDPDKIADSMIEVQNNLHLTGDAAKTVTEQVSILQKQFGQPVNIENLGMIKRAMGMTGDQVSGLLDKLYKMHTESGASINGMLGTLSRTAPLLKQANMSAGDSLGLLNQFDEAGLDAAKVVPSLAKAFKASAKAGEPFSQFLKENVDNLKKLHDAGNDTGAAELANQVFGGGVRGGAAQWLTAIQNGKLDLDHLNGDEEKEHRPGIIMAQKQNESFDDKWDKLKNRIGNDLQPIGTKLIDGVNLFLDNLPGMWNKVVSTVSTQAKNVWNDVKGAFDTVWATVKGVFDGAVNAVKSFVGEIKAFWDTMKHNVESAFKSIGDFISGHVVPIFNDLVHGVKTVVDFFLDIPNKLGNLTSSIGDKIGSFFSGLNPFAQHKAAGGPLDSAPGPIGRDSALFWGARGEHVLTASDVHAMGGHKGVFAFRKALHRDDGGPVGPDVQAAMSMEGTPYSQGSRHDCSGMVGRVITAAMGQQVTSLPTTQNMAQWLAARGFKDGTGGPGDISVGWYNHGSGYNDGHAAMTLSDGENAEAGGSHGFFKVGGGAAGAGSSEFDQHMYLPADALMGEGSAFGGASSAMQASGAGGGGSYHYAIPQGATPMTGPKGQPGYLGAPDAHKVEMAKEKVGKLQEELDKLEDRKAHLGKKTKQATRDKLDAEIERKKAEIDKAQYQLDQDEKGTWHKAHKVRDAKAKVDKEFDWQALGDIGSNGLMNSLLPDGFVNPFDTTAAHVASGLMGFFSGMDPDPVSRDLLAVGSGVASGKGGAVAKALKDIVTPSRAQLGTPAERTGGGGDTYNLAPDYRGATIGHNPNDHMQSLHNDRAAVQRSFAFGNARMPGQGGV